MKLVVGQRIHVYGGREGPLEIVDPTRFNERNDRPIVVRRSGLPTSTIFARALSAHCQSIEHSVRTGEEKIDRGIEWIGVWVSSDYKLIELAEIAKLISDD